MVKADLHTHTVLSPCGDIEMTPAFLVRRARELGIGILGVTDHNSTRQCAETRRIGEREGVFVLCGAEITTREEVHVLAFVDGDEKLAVLQRFLDENLPPVANDPEVFGYQLVVNEQEEVLHEEETLLISALDKSLDEVGAFVRSLNGIFIPAHIDKARDSLLSQLGFVPPDLQANALEVSHRCDLTALLAAHPYLSRHPFVRSSDAHYPEEIGRATTELNIETPSFQAIKEALAGRL
ncbi:PHP domain-containing protein [Alistipes sp. OttesenSCG-928-L06]|nr:PHP domain-containing protein [Alistipes sp. OttesenSCG-928-L06]